MSSKGEEEIDIDDPDFWQKWAKKADLDVDLMNKVRENVVLKVLNYYSIVYTLLKITCFNFGVGI